MAGLTFVSFLVPVKLVWKVGLPLKEFFIWGDDHEYSLRLRQVTRIYQVGKSRVAHLKIEEVSFSIVNENDYNKIWQYRWLYRNRVFIAQRYDGIISRPLIRFVFRSFKDIVFSALSGKFVLMKCKAIMYGLCAGVAFSVQMAGKDLSAIPDESIAQVTEPQRQNVA